MPGSANVASAHQLNNNDFNCAWNLAVSAMITPGIKNR
jgi:hypothetical protein